MHGRHAEAQHSATNLLGHFSIDHEAPTEELDGDLRRSDVVDDELDGLGAPETNRGRGELWDNKLEQEREE
jgi:hypothetical protein